MPRVLRANRNSMDLSSQSLLHGHSTGPYGLEDQAMQIIEDTLAGDRLNLGQYDYSAEQEDNQLIIEVTQDEVKQALKELLIKGNSVLETLYKAHESYNERYFQGRLSVPLITIDKLSHRTFSDYMVGADTTGLENHIKFNRNFVALNTETRLLEALKHEMIHQFQDEVIYEKHDKEGKLIHEGEKRPKDWHNKEFKDWALNVGIIVNGRKGYRSPAKMPEPKSYNRKFVCKCIASNGYPMTLWSTREVKATCQVCGSAYTEVKKAGEVIPSAASDIEEGGQDAVEVRMKGEFLRFSRFYEKDSLSDKIKELKRSGTPYKEGIYQKGHNAHLQGYCYWVAYGAVAPKQKSSQAKPRVSSRLKKGVAKSDKT